MKSKTYIPERNDIIWLDFEPTKGKEIGKYRPALVISSIEYNKSGLLICCPISTSVRREITEVPINNLNEPSVVKAHLVHTLSWIDRKTKFISKGESDVIEEVLCRLIPLLGSELL